MGAVGAGGVTASRGMAAWKVELRARALLQACWDFAMLPVAT